MEIEDLHPTAYVSLEILEIPVVDFENTMKEVLGKVVVMAHFEKYGLFRDLRRWEF